MTDKEFKRLNRSQLIEIIYQLQLKQEELTADNERLAKELADKRILVSEAGEIHNVMQAAQDAATHYLEELKLRGDEEYQQILEKAKEDAAAIITKAQQDAAEILLKANSDYEPAAEAIPKEQQQPI